MSSTPHATDEKQAANHDPPASERHIPIDDAGDVTLPVEEVLQGRGALLGKSGSGKSNGVSVVVEELLDAGYPVCIFDADGEYVSLKEDHEVLHVGGDEFCERVVGPEHADALAQLGIDEREPIIVDLAGYAEDDADRDRAVNAGADADATSVTRDEMVRAVASAFFNRASKAKREGRGVPYLLIAEEIHEYVPQQGGLTPAGSKLVKVAKRGRSRGLGVVGVSQRPASVDKDFLTQCDWISWFRLTWDNDTRVVGRILGSDYADAVEGLADGEAVLQTDWDEQVRRVQYRRRRTTDIGEAPGLDGAAEMDLKETDTSVLDDLDSAAAQARTKQQRIDALEQQLAEVREERDEWRERYEDAEYLADVSAEVTGAQLQDLFGGAGLEVDGDLSLDTATIEVGDSSIEVPEVIEAEVLEIRDEKRELESEVDRLQSEVADARAERDAARERVSELEGQTVANAGELREAIQRAADALDMDLGSGPERRPEASGDDNGGDAEDLERLRVDVEQLEADLEREQERREAAEERARAGGGGDGGDPELPELASYEEFLSAEPVREQIEAAEDEQSPRYVGGVLAAIVDDQQPVSYEEIAERLGLSRTNHVSAAATELENRGIVTKESRDGQTVVDLNVDGIEEVRRRAAKRDRTDALIEEFTSGGSQ